MKTRFTIALLFLLAALSLAAQIGTGVSVGRAYSLTPGESAGSFNGTTSTMKG